MPPVGFEPTISAGERPKTVLDRAATGTDTCSEQSTLLPGCSAPDKECPEPSEQEPGWASGLVWTMRSREKRLVAHGNGTPIPRSSSRSLVTNLSLYKYAIFTNLATSLKCSVYLRIQH